MTTQIHKQADRPLFPLGRTLITPGALSALERVSRSPAEFISRHLFGDFGDLCAEDINANKAAVRYGDRVFSAYVVDHLRVWVITEADRSATTVLLPEEY
jgi:hypothetical protein